MLERFPKLPSVVKKHQRLVIPMIILLVGLVVFANSLGNSFVWDDEEQIVNNNLVHSVSNWPAFFKGSTFNPAGSTKLGGLYYKPLMPFTYSLLYTLAGPRAIAFHSWQLGIHLLNAWLVYLIFYQLLTTKIAPKKQRQLWALGVSLLFLVHPINVETVVYIASLQDVLFLFWGLLAFWLTLNSTNQWWRYLLISGCLLLSLLSKETGILFIPVIALWLWQKQKDELPLFGFAMMILGSLYAVLRFGIGGVGLSKHGLSPITRISFSERLLSVPQIAWHYLHTYFWPQRLLIAQHWVVEQATWSSFWLPTIVLLTLTVIAVLVGLQLHRQQNKWSAWWWFWFLWWVLGLGLHLQLFPLDMTVAERWFYFPQVGLLGMLLTLVWLFKTKLESKVKNISKIITGIWLIVFVLLSLRSIRRNYTWKDSLTLYQHDSQYNNQAFDLSNNYGVALYREGKLNQAKQQFEKSTQIAPYWWTNWNNLGAIYEQEGDLEQATRYYQKSVENGDYYLAYLNLAQILIKRESYQQAQDFLTKQALPRYRQNPQLWDLLFMAALKTDDPSLARQALQNALKLEPTAQRQQLLQQFSSRN